MKVIENIFDEILKPFTSEAILEIFDEAEEKAKEDAKEDPLSSLREWHMYAYVTREELAKELSDIIKRYPTLESLDITRQSETDMYNLHYSYVE